MEESLLKIIKLADELNEKQEKVFAQITYTADSRKVLEIAIRSKINYTFIEKCEIQLINNSVLKLQNIIELFKSYIGGVSNE